MSDGRLTMPNGESQAANAVGAESVVKWLDSIQIAGYPQSRDDIVTGISVKTGKSIEVGKLGGILDVFHSAVVTLARKSKEDIPAEQVRSLTSQVEAWKKKAEDTESLLAISETKYADAMIGNSARLTRAKEAGALAVKELQEKLDAANRTIAEMREHSPLKPEHDEASSSILSIKNTEIRDLRTIISQRDEEIHDLKAKLAEANDTIKVAKFDRDQAKQGQDSPYGEIVEDLRKKISSMEVDAIQHNAIASTLNRSIASLKAEIVQKDIEINGLKAIRGGDSDEISRLRRDYEDRSLVVDRLNKKIEELRGIISDRDARIEFLESRLKDQGQPGVSHDSDSYKMIDDALGKITSDIKEMKNRYEIHDKWIASIAANFPFLRPKTD